MSRHFVEEYSKALANDQAALFVGAGISQGAGYPGWNALLRDIGADLGLDAADISDLAALAQWSVNKSTRTRILQVIKDQIGPSKPLPDVLRVVARLPLKNVWTTNYDLLIERSFQEVARPVDVVKGVTDMALRPGPGSVRLFKMHGCISDPSGIVIATDDYELYRRSRSTFLALLQAHMSSLSMLFLGLSFTDPNVRHVLSLIREAFHDTPPTHFAVLRPPHRDDFDTEAAFQAREAQHKYWANDLRRYGLSVVEIESYDELPGLMNALERAVAKNKVWISGSWPPEEQGSERDFAVAVAAMLGFQLGLRGESLVSGLGLSIGSASLDGFLRGLRDAGAWDLERRLIARPFPQPLDGKAPSKEHYAALRSEMARLSGTVVLVGGRKSGGQNAAGVFAEYEEAMRAGCNVIPVGCTGGAAAEINRALRGSVINAKRPTDEELDQLSAKGEPAAVVATILRVFDRLK